MDGETPFGGLYKINQMLGGIKAEWESRSHFPPSSSGSR